MSSARTLESVESNAKLVYIPHQNLEIDSIMRDAPGRIILTIPSSAVTQIESAIGAAVKCERNLAVVGNGIKRGIKKAFKSQTQAQTVKWRTDIPIGKTNQLPPEKVVIMATGSQGEDTSALVRIANGTHSDVQIMPKDTIIIVTTLTPDRIDPVAMMANKLENLETRVAIYHSLPAPPPLPKVRKKRKSLSRKKNRLSYPVGRRKVVRMTYSELKHILERPTKDKTKPNSLSPEGPYGSWGLSISPEER